MIYIYKREAAELFSGFFIFIIKFLVLLPDVLIRRARDFSKRFYLFANRMKIDYDKYYFRKMKYIGGESNPYLTFRKRLFYPLNYQGLKRKYISVCIMHDIRVANLLFSWNISILLFKKTLEILSL